MSIIENYNQINMTIPQGVNLCAVSKFHPYTAIETIYGEGHRHFGESRPQELQQKAQILPKDIEWHFIGHLQTNKVASVVEVASIIESVDSLRLLNAISKEAQKQQKTVKVLLQMHIAQEESKQGFSAQEIDSIMQGEPLPSIEIVGLMGMATYTNNREQIKAEFQKLNTLYIKYPQFTTLSMGMSGDYREAIECGSNNVRIGSSIFGER